MACAIYQQIAVGQKRAGGDRAIRAGYRLASTCSRKNVRVNAR